MKANLDGSLQNPNKAAHFAKATAELRFSFESGFAGPVHGGALESPGSADLYSN